MEKKYCSNVIVKSSRHSSISGPNFASADSEGSEQGNCADSFIVRVSFCASKCEVRDQDLRFYTRLEIPRYEQAHTTRGR
jgi:hypothetical protein